MNQPTSNAPPQPIASLAVSTLIVCYVSVAVVWLGMYIGTYYVPLCKGHGLATNSPLEQRWFNWDGEWYTRIATRGYSHQEDGYSSIAFFPAYPMLSRVVSRMTGLSIGDSLLLVSNGAFLGALFCLGLYAMQRNGSYTFALSLLLVVALFPTTWYYRMAYSESLFFLIASLVALGCQRGWSVYAIATIVGAGTACRLVGVALIPPLVIYAWTKPQTMTRRILVLAGLIPLSLWGAIAFVSHQAAVFNEPFLFVSAQRAWHERPPHESVLPHVMSLVTAAPIREVYNSAGPCYWGRQGDGGPPWLNLSFLNPLYFTFAVGCVVVGGYRGWLTRQEVLVSMGLLLIPYATHAYTHCMSSQARYASVVWPTYIVITEVLSRTPRWCFVMYLMGSALLLVTYTSRFAAWYWFF